MRKRVLGAFGVIAIISGAVPKWRTEIAARLLHHTVLVDKFIARVARVFDRLRTAVVLGFFSESVLERIGVLAYSKRAWYRPDEKASWPDLFDWEQDFVDKYVPQPPARVLIGGAGAGREPYHLGKLSYDVVAFDPILFFVEVMHRNLPPELRVQAYQAKYEDLPRMTSASSRQEVVDLTTLPAFDAAILGWCSFSHILDEAHRLQALNVFSSIVSGPILISFFSRNTVTDAPTSRLDRWLTRLPGGKQDPNLDFQIHTGVYHRFIEEEIVMLCSKANLIIDEMCVYREASHSSYVVVHAPRVHEAVEKP